MKPCVLAWGGGIFKMLDIDSKIIGTSCCVGLRWGCHHGLLSSPASCRAGEDSLGTGMFEGCCSLPNVGGPPTTLRLPLKFGMVH